MEVVHPSADQTFLISLHRDPCHGQICYVLLREAGRRKMKLGLCFLILGKDWGLVVRAEANSPGLNSLWTVMDPASSSSSPASPSFVRV